MAPGVIDLSLETVCYSFRGRKLKTVVMAVCASRKLCDCTEPWISWLAIRKRSKTVLAHGLIAIDLGEVRLINCARTDILRLHTGGSSDLMFNTKAPLHKVRCVEFAGVNRGNGDRWQAG